MTPRPRARKLAPVSDDIDAEFEVALSDVVEVEGGRRLAVAAVEERVLAAVPSARECVVVSARLRGQLLTDVLVLIPEGVDADVDHESIVRTALGGADGDEAVAIRRVLRRGPERFWAEPSGGGGGGRGPVADAVPATDDAQSLEDRKALLRLRHVADMAGARLPGEEPAADPVPVPSERIRVEFSGEGSGTAELTWGQSEIWMAMTNQRNWLPLGGWKELEPGTAVEEIIDELSYLHSRFPSMRTKFRFGPDGWPHQELSASGWTVLEVFDVEDGADEAAVDALTAVVDTHYRHGPIDLRADWPVRMGVVRRGGELVRMVVFMNHLVLDGGGGEIMLRDVGARSTEPPSGLQQLELARWQQSAEGQRQSERCLRHFAEILRTMPVPTFPPSDDPRGPRWWRAELVSPALRLALRTLSARISADQTRAMLAVYAIALARVTGVTPVVLRTVVDNRFRRQLADVVCHAAQAGLFAVDVADATVEEVVRRAGQAALTAFKYAYYDPKQVLELLDRVGRERDAVLDISSFINDRRSPSGAGLDASGPVPTAEDFAAARAAGSFRWAGTRNDPVERLFIHIDDAPDADAIMLSIEADTHALSPAQIQQLAGLIEEVAIQAALDPALDTGIRSAKPV
ncbi:MAG: condensation domain-containing protein [Catenulispora sp.]